MTADVWKKIYLSIFHPNLFLFISPQMSHSKSETGVGTRALVILTLTYLNVEMYRRLPQYNSVGRRDTCCIEMFDNYNGYHRGITS
jgi:hypothetical protein